MSPIHCHSLSEVLNQEFSLRKDRNAAYSLRAFARDLELSPSRLSEVMKGKQGLSEANAEAVARKITRRPEERAFIKDLVLAGSARNQMVRELAKERLKEAREAASLRGLREDQFKLIADWYHGAILELTQLVDFQSNANWISERLGIPQNLIEAALERLQKMGLLEIRGGRWIAKPEGYATLGEVPSSANRKFHRQILAMHAESLFADEMFERELISTILALPRERLPEFKRQLKDFMVKFWQSAGDSPKDELYSLSLQLCPVRNRSGKGGGDA